MTADKTPELTPAELAAQQEELRQIEQRDAAATAARRELAGIKAENPDAVITELSTVTVLIYRNDNATIPTTVFEHELPILRIIHGEDMVRVVAEDTAEVEDFNAAEELARLQRLYVSKDGDPVLAVYRNDPREVARAAGVKFNASDKVAAPPTSEQTPLKKAVIRKQR